jgi:hypothetical protein
LGADVGLGSCWDLWADASNKVRNMNLKFLEGHLGLGGTCGNCSFMDDCKEMARHKRKFNVKKKKYIFTAHMSIKPWRVLSTIEIHCLTMSCG